MKSVSDVPKHLSTISPLQTTSPAMTDRAVSDPKLASDLRFVALTQDFEIIMENIFTGKAGYNPGLSLFSKIFPDLS